MMRGLQMIRGLHTRGRQALLLFREALPPLCRALLRRGALLRRKAAGCYERDGDKEPACNERDTFMME